MVPPGLRPDQHGQACQHPSASGSPSSSGTARGIQNIDTLLALLSTPDAQLDPAQIQAKTDVITGYNAILANPFSRTSSPAPARAYQWYVVMKYLDNLIAWGDSLFLADTIETINEATLCYVLAANILGPRPQTHAAAGHAPARRTSCSSSRPDSTGWRTRWSTWKPSSRSTCAPGPGSQRHGSDDQSGALFGIGRSLYFCIPPNQKLLAYWDTVADRLFKIRNSENIQGVVQQLPLFDPPLDPACWSRRPPPASTSAASSAG